MGRVQNVYMSDKEARSLELMVKWGVVKGASEVFRLGMKQAEKVMDMNLKRNQDREPNKCKKCPAEFSKSCLACPNCGEPVESLMESQSSEAKAYAYTDIPKSEMTQVSDLLGAARADNQSP